MNKRKSIKHDPDLLFSSMPEISDCFQNEASFVSALEVYSEFTESLGVLSIISYDEIINMKFKIDKENKTLKHPLQLVKMFRIKSFGKTFGSKLVRSKEITYLLSRDAKIHLFKSLKTIELVDSLAMEKIFYFESFEGDEQNPNEQFVMIVEKDSKIMLRIHGVGLVEIRSFDLMSSHDTVKALTMENDVSQIASEVTFNVEYLPDKLDDKAEDFFCAFLSCNLKEENIKDILLVSGQ